MWKGAENLFPTGIRSPDRPTCSESSYRLSYHGPHSAVSHVSCQSLLSILAGCMLWNIDMHFRTCRNLQFVLLKGAKNRSRTECRAQELQFLSFLSPICCWDDKANPPHRAVTWAVTLVVLVVARMKSPLQSRTALRLVHSFIRTNERTRVVMLLVAGDTKDDTRGPRQRGYVRQMQCFSNRVPRKRKVPQNIIRGSERSSGISSLHNYFEIRQRL